jgi:hypothetical protein
MGSKAGDDEDIVDPATPRARLVSKESSSTLGFMVDIGNAATVPVRLARGATAIPAGDGGAMVTNLNICAR